MTEKPLESPKMELDAPESGNFIDPEEYSRPKPTDEETREWDNTRLRKSNREGRNKGRIHKKKPKKEITSKLRPLWKGYDVPKPPRAAGVKQLTNEEKHNYGMLMQMDNDPLRNWWKGYISSRSGCVDATNTFIGLFVDADQFMEALDDFKHYAQCNPIPLPNPFQKSIQWTYTPFVMTREAFQHYLGVNHDTWAKWKRMKPDGSWHFLRDAVVDAENQFYVQNYQMAAGGNVKDKVIARDIARQQQVANAEDAVDKSDELLENFFKQVRASDGMKQKIKELTVSVKYESDADVIDVTPEAIDVEIEEDKDGED